LASIEVCGLTKFFGSTPAVAEVSLSIASGEFVVLVGPSGCGKTTTLRIVAGFVAPDAGTISIGERDVTRLPPRLRNIGMVFQDYALFPSMTVRQNIAFGLEEHRVPKEQIRRRVDEMLSLTRMTDLAERVPKELSGGQQQRVALARALAYRPSVLLMDEPLGALDQKLREAMQSELVTIQKELGITTVLVTHDQEEAMVMADRIVVMNGGKIEQVGRPSVLYNDPTSLFAASFIGRSNQFSGKILGCDQRVASIELPSGEVIKARAGAPTLTAGDNAVCIVRPEHVAVDDGRNLEREPVNRIRATLQRLTYLGSVSEVTGRTGAGAPVSIEMPPDGASLLTLPLTTDLTFAAAHAIAFAVSTPQ
jgi:spermidine/putrescine transport system ATP-binding protein